MGETARRGTVEPWPEGLPRPGELGLSDEERPPSPDVHLTADEANPGPSDPLYSPYYTPAQLKSIKEAAWRSLDRNRFTLVTDSHGNQLRCYFRAGAFE
jgi:hypothetical protein